MRGGVGAGGEWWVEIAGAGDVFGGWEFERAVEEEFGGCVCLEEEGSGGDGGEIEGVGGVPGGVGGDAGTGWELVSKRITAESAESRRGRREENPKIRPQMRRMGHPVSGVPSGRYNSDRACGVKLEFAKCGFEEELWLKKCGWCLSSSLVGRSWNG